MDKSNHTLRFNRTRREAGILGPLTNDDETPSPWAFVGMIAASVLGAMVLGAWFWLVLGA